MSKESPTFLTRINHPEFFEKLKSLKDYSFTDIIFVRVPPMYSEAALKERNYGRGGLHLVTMIESSSPMKWFQGGPWPKMKRAFEPADFSDLNRPRSYPMSPIDKMMTSEVNALTARTASAVRRLSFDLHTREPIPSGSSGPSSSKKTKRSPKEPSPKKTPKKKSPKSLKKKSKK